ncbi:MAG: DUF1566 domain-containing protein [Myxococcaceae bacterium]|nr:DUF1566 domain-containing protein [Myxococcaceae bacterium]MBH2006664.1 DUF1566 domain-containing protein [Myxococcaceae bacterium]
MQVVHRILCIFSYFAFLSLPVQAVWSPQTYGDATNQSDRYVLSSDGLSAFDRFTNLAWTRSSGNQTRAWKDADRYCQKLLGHPWRLPKMTELHTLLDYVVGSPAKGVFEDAAGTRFWSSDASALYPRFYWVMADTGESSLEAKSQFVRCVKGPSDYVQDRYENKDNHYLQKTNKQVKDEETEIVWQRGYAISDDLNSPDDLCRSLNLGDSSWRLPTVKELFSLVEPNSTFYVNSSAFPKTESCDLGWASSTRYFSKPTDFWTVSFKHGNLLPNATENACVRCVKSGDKPQKEALSVSAEGSFSVGSDGSAHYTIPLQVPPGVQNIQPSLSLYYSSQSRNDYLGLGWSVQGISGITRCPQNLKMDGSFTAIRLTAADRFCLDGVRLQVADGTSYGADGAVYHAVAEGWSKIVSHGLCGTGPCYFTVQRKDGTFLEYGHSTDSAYLASNGSGTVFAWSVNKIQDQFGNYMLWNYENNVPKGEHYLQNVSYGGHVAGMPSRRHVVFQYENRPDMLQSYVGGSLATISKRLSHILTKVDNSTVLDYRLSYDISDWNGRSQLVGIQQCSAQGSCFPSTKIEWQTPNGTWIPGGSLNALGGELFFECNSGTCLQAVLKDLNGDGIPDFSPAYRHAEEGGVIDNRVWLGSLSGFHQANWSLPYGAYVYSHDGNSKVSIHGTLQDLNADGVADFTHAFRHSDGTIDSNIYLGTGTGFLQANWSLPYGAYLFSEDRQGNVTTRGILQDLDGDGISDFTPGFRDAGGSIHSDVYLGTGSGFKPANWSLPYGAYVFHENTEGVVTTRGVLQDLNGDGIVDFTPAFRHRDGRIDNAIYLGTGFGFEQADWVLPYYVFYEDDNGFVSTRGALLDLNGDGIIDFTPAFRHRDGTVDSAVYLGTGSGFQQADWSLPYGAFVFSEDASGDITTQGLLQNLDADRCADFSHASYDQSSGQSNNQIYMGTSVGYRGSNWSFPYSLFSLSVSDTGAETVKAQGILKDLNGDGKVDYIAISTDDRDQVDFRFFLAGPQQPSLISKITNRLGGTFSIEYASLTDPSVYTKRHTAVYPQVDVQGSTKVVASVAKNDGHGHVYKTRYQYEGAQYDLHQRSWLGYSTFVLIDESDGSSNRREFNLSAPLTGTLVKEAFLSPSGTPLKIARHAYESLPTPGFSGVNQILLKESLSEQYTDAGVYSYSLKKSFAHDAYGNPIYMADFGDPTESGVDTYTYRSYINNESSNLIGFLSENKICSTNVSDPFTIWNASTDLIWGRVNYYNGIDGAPEMTPSENIHWDTSLNTWIGSHYIYNDFGGAIVLCSLADAPCSASNPRSVRAQYDAFGFTSKIELPQNAWGNRLALTFVVEPFWGSPVSVTDANNITKVYNRDEFGRQNGTLVLNPERDLKLVFASDVVRDDNHSIYQVACTRNAWDADNVTLWPCSKAYLDGFGRVYLSTSPGLTKDQSILTEKIFNTKGQLQNQSIPRYNTDSSTFWTSYSYDFHNRILDILGPDGTKSHYIYDAVPRRVQSISAYETRLARNATIDLNSRGSTVFKRFADGSSSQYVYDRLQRTLGFTDPSGLKTNYTYDSIGRMIVRLEPDTGKTVFNYNSYGELDNKTDSEGQVFSYRYDALGRLLTSTFKDLFGETETAFYVYDDPKNNYGFGRLTSAFTAHSRTDIQYNHLGFVHQKLVNQSDIMYQFDYLYGPLGELLKSTFPDGESFFHQYYLNGFLKSTASATDNKTMFTYDDYSALGDLLNITYANSVRSDYSYFAPDKGVGQIRDFSFANPEEFLKQRNFQWDSQHEIQEIDDPLDPKLNTTFTFNSLGYLTAAQSVANPEIYDYTITGSLRKKNNQILSYRSDSHQPQLSTNPNVAWNFYKNGNMKNKTDSDGLWSYIYNGYNQLKKITNDGEVVNQFQYDAFKARIQKIDSQGNRTEYISDEYEVVNFADGSKQHTRYVFGPLGRMAAVTVLDEGKNGLIQLNSSEAFSAGPQGSGYPVSGTYYYHYDHRSSVVAVTDSDGNTVLSLHYSPYGVLNTTLSKGPDILRYKFGSHELDNEIKYYNFGRRHYDPKVAQFITPDPLRQYFSPYMYGANNPESYIDPNGEFSFWDIFAVLSVVIVPTMLLDPVISMGAYFGGQAVNHNYNPAHWDWKSAKTYEGMVAGAAVAEAGTIMGEEVGGVPGAMLAGAFENAAYSMMGGGSAKDLLISAAEGAALSALIEGAGAGLSVIFSRLRSLSEVGEVAGDSAELGGVEGETSETSEESCFFSFLEGTPVWAPSGFLSIEKLFQGNVIFAEDENGKRVRALVKLVTNRTVSELLEIRFGIGPKDFLHVTSNHKLHTRKGWVSAEDVTIDDRLTVEDGFVQVLNITLLQEGPYRVFNLGDTFGNYFVSDHKLKVEASSFVDDVEPQFKKYCGIDPLTGKKVYSFNRRAVYWPVKRLRDDVVMFHEKIPQAQINDNLMVKYFDETGEKSAPYGTKSTGSKPHSIFDIAHGESAHSVGTMMLKAKRMFTKDEVNRVMKYLPNLRLEEYHFNRKMGAASGSGDPAKVKQVILDALGISDFS